MPDLIGQRIGAYEIIALLGKGGMAEVYRARQQLGGRVAREVALKLIDARLSLTPEFIARFEREAQTLVSLSHPHILKAFDYGEFENTIYLVMELLPGGSLADRLRKGALPLSDVSHLIEQIGQALDYAHRRGVIHRDLKPQNVLLDDDGNAFLTDFGIVKLIGETTSLTQSNTSIGTPAYMAPEQWTAGAIDARTDLYALGVMLFEMLGGRVPFVGDTPYRVMYQHTHQAPPSVNALRPDLPPSVDRVIGKALAKDPADRYESAAALLADFKAAIAGLPVSAPPNSPHPQPLSQKARGATPTGIPAPVRNTPTYASTPSRTSSARRVSPLIGLIAVVAVLLILGVGLSAALNNHPTTTPTITLTDIPHPVTTVPTQAVAFQPTQPPTSTSSPLLPSPTPSDIASVTASPTADLTQIPTTQQVTTAVPTRTTVPTQTATSSPASSTTSTRTSTPTNSPTSTRTRIPTRTPSVTPSATQAISALDQARTLRAQQQTQTATHWTPTPTPTSSPTLTSTPTANATATLNANLTLLAATDLAQIALNQTAIATRWTPTPTPTRTFTATFTPTLTPTATFTATLTPSATETPNATFTATDVPTDTPFPTVTANNQWTPIPKVFNGVEMVEVPPGCFMMGSTDFTDSTPVNKQCFVTPFWIDKYPVTNAQFKQFNGKAGNLSHWSGANRPREDITWPEARIFCEQRAMELPTEAQWEYAARGPDNLAYPWGNDFADDKAVYGGNSGGQTADVGSKPNGKSWVGALDMAGNVWEWTSTIQNSYAYSSVGHTTATNYGYPYNPFDGRETGPNNQEGTRVVRGGSWINNASNLRSAYRESRHTDWPPYEGSYVGFRCVSNYTPRSTPPTLTPTTTLTPSNTPLPMVSANKRWTPQTQAFSGVLMALVPPGCFLMGSNYGNKDEQPVYKQCQDKPFWLDETPVTQAQFKQFNGKAATPSSFSSDQRPVDSITWFEAKAYCEQQRGGRLPTEAEYEYAARGPDDLIYPWGNVFIAANVVFSENSGGYTADVGSKPAGQSWVGALDMSGNVWEWTSSIYRSYPYKADDGREDNSDTNSIRVVRGGSWYNNDKGVRAAIRSVNSPSSAAYVIGFRCVRAY